MRKYVEAKLKQIADRRDCAVSDLRYAGFWGANNHQAEGWLSQWHMYPITLKRGFTSQIEWKGVAGKFVDTPPLGQAVMSYPVESVKLPSAEHAMMYMKAMLFNDHDSMAEVTLAKTPADAKAIGRRVKNYNNEMWDAVRYQVVKEINQIKFSTPEGREVLEYFSKTAMGTMVVFVETSPYDAIWGIKGRHCVEPELWEGDNLLGFAHTDVYDEIIWGLK